ncbi:MAG: hypothetical protein M3Z08_13200 [Chloroflexota bacterium]|nr:hypothetical protein [Chloroflexota bacterium]
MHKFSLDQGAASASVARRQDPRPYIESDQAQVKASAGFSEEDYRELLGAFTSAGYAFCSFEEITQRLRGRQPFVVLRHDIDISLHLALKIARIEHEQGIQATYFVTLHSPFYNALSRSNAEILAQIHQWGHQVALHMDQTAYEGDFAKALLEINALAQFYPYINTQLASLHSPINLEQMPLASFKELLNVYGPIFNKDLTYLSDSTGRWRFGYPLDSEAFKARKPIQLLTHPIWWTQDGEMARQKLKCWLYKDYLNTLAAAKEFLPKLFA